MKRPLAAILLTVLLSANIASANATDDVQPYAPEIPVVLADFGLVPTPDEVTAAASILGGTIVRGRDIGKYLSLDKPPRAAANLETMLQKAQNLYYNGDYDTCHTALNELMALIDQEPTLWINVPSTPEVAFLSLIYKSLVAREQGHEEQLDAYLLEAVSRFPALRLSTRDFPPWLLQRHAELLASTPTTSASLPVEIPTDCRLFVDGKETSTKNKTATISTNARIAHVTCPDRISRVSRIFSATSNAPWRPVFLPPGKLALRENDAVLDMTSVSKSTIEQFWIQLGRAGGWPRIAVISADADQVVVEIVETNRGSTVHRAVMNAGLSMQEIAASSPRLKSELFNSEPLKDSPALREKQRVRDPLAWTLVGTGIAAFTTGLVLGLTQGEHTATEPAAVTLQITGAATALAGGVLFFVPAVHKTDDRISASATILVSF